MSQSAEIPIQNLYYLLCYAWNRLEQSSLIDVTSNEAAVPSDFFASVLVKGIQHLKRRGLNKGYLSECAELLGIRGRVDILTTERRLLLPQGRASCIFDELTIDTPANRILKATLRVLKADPDINRESRVQLNRSIREFQGISDVQVGVRDFRNVHLDRNSAFYRFLLSICELILTVRIPEKNDGRLRFRDFIRDERKMAFLFQHFVFNFLRIERRDLTVQRENIPWSMEPLADGTKSLLPIMQTDISVTKNGCKVIIDTKYYRETLSEYHGAKRIRSEHLYQLLSYLGNARSSGESVEGMLLYPFVDRELKEAYQILGINIRVETLDLNQPWNSLRNDLMQLVTL